VLCKKKPVTITADIKSNGRDDCGYGMGGGCWILAPETREIQTDGHTTDCTSGTHQAVRHAGAVWGRHFVTYGRQGDSVVVSAFTRNSRRTLRASDFCFGCRPIWLSCDLVGVIKFCLFWCLSLFYFHLHYADGALNDICSLHRVRHRASRRQCSNRCGVWALWAHLVLYLWPWLKYQFVTIQTSRRSHQAVSPKHPTGHLCNGRTTKIEKRWRHLA